MRVDTRLTAQLRRAVQLLTMPLALAAAGCSIAGAPPAGAGSADPGYGPNPTLPPPQKSLVPTVRIAPARPWPPGTAPVPAAGLAVRAFASGLEHPRWLHVLPNGDVLVAETNAPPRPEASRGVTGVLMKGAMKRAGAAVPSANRITLLRDADGDGAAETREVLLQNLNSPFGMALVGEPRNDGPLPNSSSPSGGGSPKANLGAYRLYVANTDALVWFPYRTGDTRITAPLTRVVDLPGGPINHHWTKSLIANADGSRLYVTAGSNSNVAERGLAAEEGRAAIWEVDPSTGGHRVFATGLRNPNGMGWEPGSRVLWTVVNERDGLGDNLVPDYALGSHTASLGLAFSAGTSLGPDYAHGVFVGQHGSWNREPPSGYKVIFVPFDGPKPRAGAMPADVLTGFLGPQGEARGRPVGVALDKRGALLVADDVGNTVWRVSRASR